MRYSYGGQDVFALPGGSPNRGEILPETIIREIREELGISIEVGEMILAGEMLLTQRNDDVLHVVFAVRTFTGTPVLNPDETTALDVVWKPITNWVTLIFTQTSALSFSPGSVVPAIWGTLVGLSNSILGSHKAKKTDCT